MNNYNTYNRMSCQKAKNDLSLERKIGDFVFSNLWSRMGAAERVSDMDLQIRGVDVQIGKCNIDEKVKYYDSRTKGFMTELLRCPSFEVSFVNQSGNIQDGWFVNPDNITTHYAFIQPFSRQHDPKLFDINDLEKVNVLVVKKSDLTEIEDSVNLEDEADELRSSFYYTQERRKKFTGKNFWLTYSPDFNEKPVNLVVPRDVLKRMENSREIEIMNDGRLVNVR